MNVVAFVDENQLGHSSYLPRYTSYFDSHPELGIKPILLRATPVPARYRWHTDTQIRLLRKWGLDFHNARWRLGVSGYVRESLERLDREHSLHAIVVNTQSVGLKLKDFAKRLRLCVCLDATFQQLSRSAWFAPNSGSRFFLPLTGAPVMRAERNLFEAAQLLLPWSEGVADSLRGDYSVPPGKIQILPPSLDLNTPPRKPNGGRPEVLFVGGDFRRKGGPILLEAFRKHLRSRADLHVLTQSPIDPEPGVIVHRDLKPYTEPWLERWRNASVFVFPSNLDTFGIVLIEALAFGVPVVANRVGAAEDALDQGKAGWLLSSLTVDEIGSAIRDVLDRPDEAARRAEAGRRRFLERFELGANARRFARLIQAEATT